MFYFRDNSAEACAGLALNICVLLLVNLIYLRCGPVGGKLWLLLTLGCLT